MRFDRQCCLTHTLAFPLKHASKLRWKYHNTVHIIPRLQVGESNAFNPKQIESQASNEEGGDSKETNGEPQNLLNSWQDDVTEVVGSDWEVKTADAAVAAQRRRQNILFAALLGGIAIIAGVVSVQHGKWCAT
jgi:hypothetical protein